MAFVHIDASLFVSEDAPRTVSHSERRTFWTQSVKHVYQWGWWLSSCRFVLWCQSSQLLWPLFIQGPLSQSFPESMVKCHLMQCRVNNLSGGHIEATSIHWITSHDTCKRRYKRVLASVSRHKNLIQLLCLNSYSSCMLHILWRQRMLVLHFFTCDHNENTTKYS